MFPLQHPGYLIVSDLQVISWNTSAESPVDLVLFQFVGKSRHPFVLVDSLNVLHAYDLVRISQ